MNEQNGKSATDINLISLLGLLVGNSIDYLKLFLPLLIFYKLYIKFHAKFKKGKSLSCQIKRCNEFLIISSLPSPERYCLPENTWLFRLRQWHFRASPNQNTSAISRSWRRPLFEIQHNQLPDLFCWSTGFIH